MAADGRVPEKIVAARKKKGVGVRIHNEKGKREGDLDGWRTYEGQQPSLIDE